MITYEIGKFILQMEGRRDADGNLSVYILPKGDGGGTYEIAGINDKYHPEMALKLKKLIEAKKYLEAEEESIKYIIKYTDFYSPWHPDERVAVFLRDCKFNRGPTGAAKIFQHSLKVAQTYKGLIDGKVGSNTIGAANKHAAEDLLPRLLLSRQWYERVIIGRNETNTFWSGLTNRWINAFQVALSIGNPYNNLQSIKIL
jgi:hypothetical protein